MSTRPRETRPGRRTTPPPAASAESTDTPTPPPAPSASASAESELERVSFYVTKDGEPVWDRMHAATKEKVQRLRGGGPSGGPSAKPVNPLVSAALTKATVASVPVFLQIALRLLGFTPESVAGVTLTDTQRAELAPLYEAAIADYGVALGRHENLIVALGMTGLMLAPAFEKLERAKKSKPNGSAGGPLLDIIDRPEQPGVTASSPN